MTPEERRRDNARDVAIRWLGGAADAVIALLLGEEADRG